MLSAFGVDHGEISKKNNEPSTGRKVATAAFPGYHGAFAGKKGHKLRAAGNEYGRALGGSLGGGALGAGVGALVTRGHPAGAIGGAEAGALAGGWTGSVKGAKVNQRRGHYKKEGY